MDKVYCYIKVPETVNGEFHDKWRLARAYENESGYYPYGKQNKDDPLEFDKFVGTSEYIDAIVNAWNKRLGISKHRAEQIKATTF